MRERELKQQIGNTCARLQRSLPMRERELKRVYLDIGDAYAQVAPHAGA